MQQIFTVLLKLFKFLGDSSQKIDWAITTLAGFICLIAESFRNPEGAINTFMIKVVEVMLIAWPQTPPEYKIANLILGMRSYFPGFQWVIVLEIVQGLAGILAIVLIVKFRKL